MRLIRDITSLPSIPNGSVATIGNFDGLHLGHQRILAQLKQQGEQRKLPTVVISFEPLPIEYFSGHQSPRVYPFRDKVRNLSQLGIDYFLCLRFNDPLANMPPETFIHEILFNTADVKHLVVGDDFCFGRKREGDYALLKQMGAENNMLVSNSHTHSDDDGRISSTRIRQHLAQGDINSATTLLGRDYVLSGRVRHGDKKGRTIGFPTMNLRIQDNIAAANGVYAVHIDGLSAERRMGVANLGNRPTVEGVETRLEVHVFDFDEFVYGQHINVELVSFLRAEKRFENFEALTSQITHDAKAAKKLLTNSSD